MAYFSTYFICQEKNEEMSTSRVKYPVWVRYLLILNKARRSVLPPAIPLNSTTVARNRRCTCNVTWVAPAALTQGQKQMFPISCVNKMSGFFSERHARLL